MADNDPQSNVQQNQQGTLPGGGETSVGGSGAQAPAASPPAPPAKPENPAAKSRRTFIIVAVVLLLALVAGFFYYRSTFSEGTDDAQVDGDLYQVSARVAGQVVKVEVSDNQKVNQGDVIAEIDPRDYQVALEQAEAQLANAKAGSIQANVNVPIIGVQTRTTIATSGQDVATGEAGVAQASKQVSAAQARVDEAKANALKAQLDVERYTPLVAKDVISKQQFDQAVATAAATNASLLEAQQNVIAQQAGVRQAQARLDASRATARQAQITQPQQVEAQQARANAATADIQQQQARVDQARLNLTYCRITAPVTGIINRKTVAVGGNVSVGQNLLTIVPVTGLWITANYKETQLQHMQVGQKVDIKVDALGGRQYRGTVTQIGGATGSRLSLFPPENATGNYVKVVQRIPVRINLDQGENNDQLLRAGYSVDPEVHVK